MSILSMFLTLTVMVLTIAACLVGIAFFGEWAYEAIADLFGHQHHLL